MPRENSFSDSDGRSLTPDLESEEGMVGQSPPTSISKGRTMSNERAFGYPASEKDVNSRSLEASATPTMVMSASANNGVFYEEPECTAAPKPQEPVSTPVATPPRALTNASTTPSRPGAGIDRFRAAARNIITMRRGSRAIWGELDVGAEPGVDARKSEAFALYGHIHANCQIDVIDYSSVRSMFGKFDNKGFLEYLGDPRASKRDSWVKVRWINVVGISWDVMSSLALNYGTYTSLGTSCSLYDASSQKSTLLRWKISFMAASSHGRKPTII